MQVLWRTLSLVRQQTPVIQKHASFKCSAHVQKKVSFAKKKRSSRCFILIPAPGVLLFFPFFVFHMKEWFSVYASFWFVNRTLPQHFHAKLASALKSKILVSYYKNTVQLGICGVNISTMCCFFSCYLMNKRYAFIWYTLVSVFPLAPRACCVQ